MLLYFLFMSIIWIHCIHWTAKSKSQHALFLCRGFETFVPITKDRPSTATCILPNNIWMYAYMYVCALIYIQVYKNVQYEHIYHVGIIREPISRINRHRLTKESTYPTYESQYHWVDGFAPLHDSLRSLLLVYDGFVCGLLLLRSHYLLFGVCVSGKYFAKHFYFCNVSQWKHTR